MTAEFGPIRFHHLKAMGRSPLHCLQSLTCAPRKPTAAMRLGTAIHALLFGTREVVAFPGATRRGKAWETFAADRQDCEILLLNEYDNAMGAVDAITKCKTAMDVLRGEREETLLFDHIGMRCRVTPDVRGDGYVTELKSTNTADPFRFTSHATRMGYHAQLAWQRIGVASSDLGQPQTAYVVAVEQSAPYAVTVLRLTDRALEAGDRLCRLWSERLKVCLDSGTWPAYSDAIVDLDVPDDLGLMFEDEDGNSVTESQDVPF